MGSTHNSNATSEDLQRRLDLLERTNLNLQTFYNGKILGFVSANQELQEEIRTLTARLCMLEGVLMKNHPAMALLEFASEEKRSVRNSQVNRQEQANITVRGHGAVFAPGRQKLEHTTSNALFSKASKAELFKRLVGEIIPACEDHPSQKSKIEAVVSRIDLDDDSKMAEIHRIVREIRFGK